MYRDILGSGGRATNENVVTVDVAGEIAVLGDEGDDGNQTLPRKELLVRQQDKCNNMAQRFGKP